MNDSEHPNELGEGLLSQLGLEEQPFKDHAGDGYLYSDSNLDMTSNIIMEYLANPATTIVLTGERGVGKTTFLRKVLRLGYQRYQFCTVRVREDTNFEFIEGKIKQRWELSPVNVKSPVIDLSIENYVISYLREYPHAVLIIDDAHNLDAPTLDRLLTLKHRIGLACPEGMGFILAGEPSLKVKITELEESNPACTQTYQIDVRPLNKEQTESYLLHRLITAGLDSNPFSESDISLIYDLSAGNISKIHYHAARLLRDQLNQQIFNDSSSVYPQHKKLNPRVLVIIIAVILGLIVFGVYKQYQSQQNEQEIIALPQVTPEEPDTEDVVKPEQQETMTPPQVIPEEPDTEDVVKSEIGTSVFSYNSGNQPIDDTTINKSVSGDENIEQDAEEIAKQDPLLAESIEQIDDDTQEQPAQEQSKPVESQIPTSGEGWLKNIDPAHYTLQVIATQDLKQLKQLIKSEKLTDGYAFFSKPVNGKTYYVLVVGEFDSREKAVEASKQLPNTLRKNKPWPVPLSKIHPYLK
jgi:septal ring-binding cell division protein DamX/type II secretory pathway predicted ATPase ExeA